MFKPIIIDYGIDNFVPNIGDINLVALSNLNTSWSFNQSCHSTPLKPLSRDPNKS